MSEQKLPVVDPEATEAATSGAVPPPPVEVNVSALRLIGTLTLASVIAGIAIVVAFKWTKPTIDAHDAQVLAAGITEVLGGASRYQTVYLDKGSFTPTPADTTGLQKVYVGYDEAGKPTGVAMEGAEPGFQDIIDLLFGYDPATNEVVGMTVLQNNETPGLGARIATDSAFIKAFIDVGAPILGIKATQGTPKHDEVVMITGSTISSRAVIKIIDDKLAELKKPVDAYWATIAGTAATNGAAGGAGGASTAGAPKAAATSSAGGGRP